MLQMPHTILGCPLFLSFPLMFKEDFILRKIHYNRNNIKIQGDPVPLHANPNPAFLEMKEVKVTPWVPCGNHSEARHVQAVLVFSQPFAHS